MFRKTVDGVLRALNKAITELEIVAEQQRGVAAGAFDEQRRQALIQEAADFEADRAERVRDKLKELLA